MVNNNLIYLQLIPVVLQFLFWIGVFVYLMTRRRQYPRPTKYALWGVAVHIVVMVTFLVLRILLPKFVALQTLPTMFTILSFFNTLASIVATWLLLVAIFAGRESPVDTPIVQHNPGVPLADRTDHNPYASP